MKKSVLAFSLVGAVKPVHLGQKMNTKLNQRSTKDGIIPMSVQIGNGLMSNY
jgi:hypothetical protein